MFTGIIQFVVAVQRIEKRRGMLCLTLQKPVGWKLKIGDSIATNGICLTVRSIIGRTYQTELMAETLAKTSFDESVPKRVNVERSLRLSERLDGHLVQGHVDAVGKILSLTQQGSSKIFTISLPKKFAHLVVAKGSIAVDGISLTVVDALAKNFTVSVMEYTLLTTTLGEKSVGAPVNLEFDMVAKYLERLMRKK